MGLLLSLLIASCFSLSVAVYELLQYVTRRHLAVMLRMVLVPSDFVTGICTLLAVSYYAVNGILFEWSGLTTVSLL